MKRVVVIGGGLAGMAAAVALESIGGLSITLLEARRRLGGRAGSFQEPQTGEELDNCQHVLLGCCTNLIDFYRRTGADRLIRFEDAIGFVDGGGRRYELRGVAGWPAPLHLGPSLARFGALTIAERAALVRAMVAMMRLGREGRLGLADVPFGQWLDEQKQPASLVEKMYEPILVSALNEESRRVSSSYAIQVFLDSLLANAAGYRLGLPNGPLGKLYESIPCRDVRLGARVSGVRFCDGAACGVELQGGELLAADAVVLATNYQNWDKFVPAELASADERFRYLDRLEDVPILGAHLWFDRPVLRESHAALMSGPLQWLFRKDEEGKAVHGVISAARAWVNRPREQCLAEFEQQVRATLPGAAGAKLERGVVVVEKRATFSPVPGVDRYRPAQAPPAGGIQNLFLAGDYTRTGWPATMEGAVRSGYLAAEFVADSLMPGVKRRFLVDDLPLEWPARLVGQW